MAKQKLISVSQINKATKLMARIREINSKLERYQKLALEMAEKPIKLQIGIIVPDSNEKPKTAQCEEESWAEVMHRRMMEGASPFAMFQIKTNKLKDSLMVHETIDEYEALSIFGVLIEAKQKERRELIEKLKNMGIEIC